MISISIVGLFFARVLIPIFSPWVIIALSLSHDNDNVIIIISIDRLISIMSLMHKL